MTERLQKAIDFMKNTYGTEIQVFFTRNIVGDSMTNVYSEDGIDIDYCSNWWYLEVFGLTDEEKQEVSKIFQ